MEERKIIKQCKKGNRKAFELLVHRYSPLLHAICLRYMQDNASAKDALQQSWISIFRGIETVDESKGFGGWARKVTVNCCLMELRKRKSQDSLLAAVESFDNQTFESNLAIDKLNKEEILFHINSLPEMYRIAINLYIIEDYDYHEISKMLKVDEATCRMRVSRGRKKLQQKLITNQCNYGFETTRKVD